jgi:hypothetical protein
VGVEGESNLAAWWGGGPSCVAGDVELVFFFKGT